MSGKSKKSYTRSDFSIEDVQRLIDLVREEPCLYNVRHPQYKKFQVRQRKWEFIGTQIDKTGE